MSAVLHGCAGQMVAIQQTEARDDGDTDGSGKIALPEASNDPTIGNIDAKRSAHEDLLYWAIRNSDPDKIADLAARYQAEGLTIKDKLGQELFDEFFVEETDIMKRIVSHLKNDTLIHNDPDAIEADLLELEELMHQVDNAMNLRAIGGMGVVVSLIFNDTLPASVRTAATWTIGTAAQNNQQVQADLRELNFLPRMGPLTKLECAHSGFANLTEAHAKPSRELCGKLLYTLSAIIKNNRDALAEADQLGVFTWMVDALPRFVEADRASAPILKKVVALLETALVQRPDSDWVDHLALRQPEESMAVVLRSLLSAPINTMPDGRTVNLDLSEKLLALGAAIYERSSAANSFAGNGMSADPTSLLAGLHASEASVAAFKKGADDVVSGCLNATKADGGKGEEDAAHACSGLLELYHHRLEAPLTNDLSRIREARHALEPHHGEEEKGVHRHHPPPEKTRREEL
ncbi:unnamed protein product [Vitrella brassicaformis CCMP3155]|uniref:Nucleotide exchange factor Fes1 domain-containing protein n=1 Tax=Vitrella brassicaformis (strain CCMP3155) TaxID=1169540 RepID=A0A0G4EUI6_VITBC|nr:unnamed protein product [Vitrella brassicaformis CCMP3155]|eukprot:CEM01965.1 unnamed protein product [Vitrella brassicaformis CCMP3155]